MEHEDIRSLGDIVCGKITGRKNEKEKIIFITGGMPVEDIAWGYSVYQKAVEKGIGTELKLWDEPHWY